MTGESRRGPSSRAVFEALRVAFRAPRAARTSRAATGASIRRAPGRSDARACGRQFALPLRRGRIDSYTRSDQRARPSPRSPSSCAKLDDGLVFANPVADDQITGHRHDVEAFHAALREIDSAAGDWLGAAAATRPVARAHRLPRRRPRAPAHRPHARSNAPLPVPPFRPGRAPPRLPGLPTWAPRAMTWLAGREADGLPGAVFLGVAAAPPDRSALALGASVRARLRAHGAEPPRQWLRCARAELPRSRLSAALSRPCRGARRRAPRDRRPALVPAARAGGDRRRRPGPSRGALAPPAAVPRLGARRRRLPAHAPAHGRDAALSRPPPGTPYDGFRWQLDTATSGASATRAGFGTASWRSPRRRATRSRRALGLEPLGGELTARRRRGMPSAWRAPFKGASFSNQRHMPAWGNTTPTRRSSARASTPLRPRQLTRGPWYVLAERLRNRLTAPGRLRGDDRRLRHS